MPANPTYVGHANLIRTMVSRSSYKKAVYTSEESPETVRLFVSACMSPWGLYTFLSPLPSSTGGSYSFLENGSVAITALVYHQQD